ncbi:ATP-binding protein [Salipiger thiooxidans]|uniref:ATP-binding protein n=1 Tax=Salipiger thiooxidans TaxID=282683 RepID=UPI001CD40ADB|nr:ATP-binding protein [Salipiger thiooxidans]MCA0847001.1 sensor histidine kinase N-terminal domain-containing protein [Salipiger thiooxidans]
MTSIRGRLLAILLLATGLIWLAAVVWTQHSTRREVIHVLDRRLQESAQMVASLVGEGGLAADAAASALVQRHADVDGFALRHQLSCQIWGLDGELISESQGAPNGTLGGSREGFSETRIDGELWRVYTLVDPEHGFRVMVGDAQAIRDHLVRGVTVGLMVPMLLALPILAGLIWWTVGRGLRPVDRLGAALSARDASDLSPIGTDGAPRELHPMISALNGLLRRVGQARDRERSFTAFAAHELKTPLAGLKTQAEVARMAPDDSTRDNALDQMAEGVRRTDRMVKQLLEMTAVEHGVSAEPAARQDGALLLERVASDLTQLASARGVSIRTEAPQGLWSTASATLLQAALRNLIENAVQASRPGGAVEVALSQEDGQARFRVADRGPGIAEADRPHVLERFYRSAGAAAGGSGLGLSIVAAAVERMGGALRLAPREGGGEVAELILPAE